MCRLICIRFFCYSRFSRVEACIDLLITYISKSSAVCLLKYYRGESTRGETTRGAKRQVGGETTREETTRGETSWGRND